MNQHDFKPGDRAIVLPMSSFYREENFGSPTYFMNGSICEILNSRSGIFACYGVHFYTKEKVTQYMYLEELLPLQPHHTGLPDYLDAE